MSEKEHFEPQAPTKKRPTPEELAEMASRITITEKWRTDEHPLTPEILQDTCRRLADEIPMSSREWENLINTLYAKVSYSKQPEAQQLWELAIERGVDGLAHLVKPTTVEQIRKLADAETKDPRNYWANSVARFWHNDITRVLSNDVGTTSRAIERLAGQLMTEASIPFTRIKKELDPEMSSVGRNDLIYHTAKAIVLARMHSQGSQTFDQALYDKEVQEVADKAFRQI